MEAAKQAQNPVCTSGHDLPTPPWGNDRLDPGEPHPDEPGLWDCGPLVDGAIPTDESDAASSS